jgi:hypothetical protein
MCLVKWIFNTIQRTRFNFWLWVVDFHFHYKFGRTTNIRYYFNILLRQFVNITMLKLWFNSFFQGKILETCLKIETSSSLPALLADSRSDVCRCAQGWGEHTMPTDQVCEGKKMLFTVKSYYLYYFYFTF